MADLGKQNKVIKNLPLPEGMTPDKAVQLLAYRLKTYVKDLKQFSCANAVITVTEPSFDMGTQTVHPGDVIFSDDHCKNQRAEHSRFCTKCREEALAKRAAEPKQRIEPPKRVHYSRKKRKAMKAKHGATQGRHT